MKKGHLGKKYTSEFKKQIVRLYESGKSISTLNREYGVTRVTIRRWINKSKEKDNSNISKHFSGVMKTSNKKTIEKDYIKLLEEEEKLRLENEILKKANDIQDKTAINVAKFIYKHKDRYTVKKICEVLEFPIDTYYNIIKGFLNIDKT